MKPAKAAARSHRVRPLGAHPQHGGNQCRGERSRARKIPVKLDRLSRLDGHRAILRFGADVAAGSNPRPVRR